MIELSQIDPLKLIEAVKDRPELYVTSKNSEVSNEARTQLWEEVSEIIGV